MESDTEPVKISKFARVLAWIHVGCGALVLVGVAYQLAAGSHTKPGAGAILGLILALGVFLPLFGFVAWTGRSPRFMTSMENVLDDEAKASGIPLKANDPARKVVPLVSSVVFGLMLIFFGNRLEIFEGETGWFAIAIFAVAWIIVTALLWRNHRRGPNP